jgi:glucose-6-phosphate 1-dehydrogenase
MQNKAKLPNTVRVIFGAADDLTWRKPVPALYSLFLDDLLPEKFAIMGVDGRPIFADVWQKRLRGGVEKFSRHGRVDTSKWEVFADHFGDCLLGDFKKAITYETLAKSLMDQDRTFGDQTAHIFYLATPPAIVEDIVRNLGQAGLSKDPQMSRLVFEKPFGHDLASARAINQSLLDVMSGDATLFMRADQVEMAWSVIDPVLEVWSSIEPSDFPNYPSSSWGPESAEALIAQDKRNWL